MSSYYHLHTSFIPKKSAVRNGKFVDKSLDELEEVCKHYDTAQLTYDEKTNLVSITVSDTMSYSSQGEVESAVFEFLKKVVGIEPCVRVYISSEEGEYIEYFGHTKAAKYRAEIADLDKEIKKLQSSKKYIVGQLKGTLAENARRRAE